MMIYVNNGIVMNHEINKPEHLVQSEHKNVQWPGTVEGNSHKT